MGELSPIGERQHFLLGEKVAKIYIDDLKFLPEEYDPKQIFIASTNFNRTIMSGASEILGYYNNWKHELLTGDEDTDSIPPFPVDGFEQLKRDLDKKVTPQNYQQIPLHLTNDGIYDEMFRG